MPDWILILFVFAFGICIGSFLNVVIYRLPREKSLVKPPSSCPKCGQRIRFYDNIPLLSWLALRGKCRFCKAPISIRYFTIELLTGLVFVGLLAIYFYTDVRKFEINSQFGIGAFFQGGWYFYLIHIAMLAALITASAIDLELWIIPLSICWFITAIGLAGASMAGVFIAPDFVEGYNLFPVASLKVAWLALGSAAGMAISLLLLKTGLLKQSYEMDELPESDENPLQEEPEFNHRLESGKEILFLLPIILGAVAGGWLAAKPWPAVESISQIMQNHFLAGLMGSLWGYFIGCAVVWATRIFGTLAFGKEAMGLGDVHLMGAAGAVIGPTLIVVAFFVAPFFGLIWAAILAMSKKTKQIPYGPFLSLGILVVMILHDWIVNYFQNIRIYR